MKLTIALDWDNTFTKNTKLWSDFITMCKDHKYNIYIITSRGEDWPLEFIPDGIDGVVYCNFKAKSDVAKSQGIDVDIWIDDNPLWINRDF